MFTLISFVSIILSVHGASRYIIDEYTIPDLENFQTGGSIATSAPFPIDVCVSYLVQLNVITLVSSYGKFTCNANGDEVTFTDYGADDSCTTAVTGDTSNSKTISYNAGLAATALGAFNCDGEDNYVQIGAYTVLGDKSALSDGGAICCGAEAAPDETYIGVTITTLATGVCVEATNDDGTVYTSGTCDNTGSVSNIYTTSDCSGTAIGQSEEGTATSATCPLLVADFASAFRRQTNCVVNGDGDNPAVDFCATASPTADTTAPTGSPTRATDPPTKMPSVSPTEATDEPSKAPSGTPTTAAPTEQETSSTGYVNIVNYIVLLVMGMAIFVN